MSVLGELLCAIVDFGLSVLLLLLSVVVVVVSIDTASGGE